MNILGFFVHGYVVLVGIIIVCAFVAWRSFIALLKRLKIEENKPVLIGICVVFTIFGLLHLFL